MYKQINDLHKNIISKDQSMLNRFINGIKTNVCESTSILKSFIIVNKSTEHNFNNNLMK